LTLVGPDGPEDMGRAFRPPRSGTRRARALPRRLPTTFAPADTAEALTRTSLLRNGLMSYWTFRNGLSGA
jgi:hypothetical protein